MTRYRYRSIPPAGVAATGEIEAADTSAAVAHLQAEGHYPLEIKDLDGVATAAGRDDAVAPESRRMRPLAEDVAALAIRQLATLVDAGVPLERALALTADLMRRSPAAPVLHRLRMRIVAGVSLSTALAGEAEAFGSLTTAMARAGEESGRLGHALGVAAGWLERSRDLGAALRSALTYPVVLLCVSAAAIVLLLGFVMPRFEIMFRDMADRLPWTTRAVLTATDALASYGPAVLLLLLLIGVAIRWHVTQPAGRRLWHGVLLRSPLVGGLLHKREIERFTRALANLVDAGVALPEAVELARATLGNQALEDATAGIAGDIRQGLAPGEALARCRCFPDAVIGLVSVGEETGRLAAMLEQAAELHRREVETETTRLLTLLTPALTIGLGLLIAAIILSLLLPMLGLYESIL